ncbi:MAG: class I SAM-dependent methyltransferase [Gammaproteobacteria bacterium]|nr:class I SAM-dependent methyltransferase [Gammaproteobacteria bacterium]
MHKPFAQSCEDNKQVILEQLRELFAGVTSVLEIGSGTGQHAVYFSQHLPHLQWQPTELKANLPGIQQWIDDAALSNILLPLELDVMQQPARPAVFDAVFTANTLHIMSIKHVEALFAALGQWLRPGGLFCCYGPFNKNGAFSSESNANFDRWLKQRDHLSGIRDMAELRTFASQQAIRLVEDIEMPVNNRLLVWKKEPVAFN